MSYNSALRVAIFLALTLLGCTSHFQSTCSQHSSEQTNDQISSSYISRAEFEKSQKAVAGVLASLTDRFTDTVIMNAKLKIELRKLRGQPTHVAGCEQPQQHSTRLIELRMYANIPTLITLPNVVNCKRFVGEKVNFNLSLVDESNLLYVPLPASESLSQKGKVLSTVNLTLDDGSIVSLKLVPEAPFTSYWMNLTNINNPEVQVNFKPELSDKLKKVGKRSE